MHSLPFIASSAQIAGGRDVGTGIDDVQSGKIRRGMETVAFL